ncbi:MAG: hypothetical protein EBZ95_07530 [Chitinophagia bacterium]|nr:hypothetical protein [Chitinophagia bacterium]
MMLLDITTLIGHLHPVVVHLPIGFLTLAILFELLSYFKKFEQLKIAIPITLLVGFITAVLSCVFGYILSLSGEYEFSEINNHKIAGITLAVASGILFITTIDAVKKIFSIHRLLFSSLCVVVFLLMIYTGHQGGSLTHGSDYLSVNVISEPLRKKPSSVGEALLFEDVVHPILIQRCGQCHREGKMKGQFSVQSLETLLKGGKTRSAVVAGSLSKSELYNRITIDPSNEKYMPADGKTPLTKTEKEIIIWWIEKGMATKGKKIADLKNTQEIQNNVAAYLGLSSTQNLNDSANIENSKINPEIPTTFNMAIIDSLRNKGVNVRIMLHQPVMLDITIPPGFGSAINSINSNLKSIAKNVIWLNISNNELTENELGFLPSMSNLEKLRLEKNPITDKIIDQLAGLKHLEALNLNETNLTEVGIQKLKQLPGLKRVYQWNVKK